ncbi:MAG: hypothetical protein AB7L09_02250 [Nitrospira sp.]
MITPLDKSDLVREMAARILKIAEIRGKHSVVYIEGHTVVNGAWLSVYAPDRDLVFTMIRDRLDTDLPTAVHGDPSYCWEVVIPLLDRFLVLETLASIQ